MHRYDRATRRGTRRGGFTLVEVAVALVIFVFGALAIVRIFPRALGIIQDSESRTKGIDIARGTVERLMHDQSAIPDAVRAMDVNAGWDDTPAAVVGNVRVNSSLPPLAEDVQDLETKVAASALGGFKFIQGEHHTVKTRSGGQTFALVNFPYAAGAFGPVTLPRTFTETTISGVTVDTAGNLDFTNSTLDRDGQTFSDPTNPNRPLSYRTGANPGGYYYVSYRYVDSTGAVNGVVDEPVYLPSDADPTWGTTAGVVLAATYQAGVTVVPGRVKVRARFEVPMPAVAIAQAERMTGYVPVAAGTFPSGFSEGDTVSIDYPIDDWRWIMDLTSPKMRPDYAMNTTLPNPMPRAVQLPVTHIDPEVRVWGMQLSPENRGNPDEFNIQTGDWLGLTANSPLMSPADPRNVPVQQRAGRVYYDINDITPASGRGRFGPIARTTFRGVDGWAQQLSVAARSYTPIRNPAVSMSFWGEPWREYEWRQAVDPDYIYFHASEAGKTVLVSFYTTAGTLVSDSLITLDQKTVNAASISPPIAAGYAVNGLVSRGRLVDATGNPVAAASILSVQGCGVQVRTAWLNNDRYTHSLVTGYRVLP